MREMTQDYAYNINFEMILFGGKSHTEFRVKKNIYKISSKEKVNFIKIRMHCKKIRNSAFFHGPCPFHNHYSFWWSKKCLLRRSKISFESFTFIL